MWKYVVMLALAFAGVEARADDVSPNQGLLGDWGGLRTRLYQKGVDFQLGYTTELAYNTQGGDSNLLRNADQLNVGATFDLDRLLGWSRAKFQITRGRHRVSGRIAGDRSTSWCCISGCAPAQNPGTALHGGGGVWVSFALDRSTGTLFTPVGNPGPDYNNRVRPGSNLFTNSVVALDALTGKLKWWYQLVPNDDHDWDTTVVSLFDAGDKKLAATAGKDGVLHVLSRDDGSLAFKLPVTTQLNHEVPLTPEGVRVCPVAGVQWNGPAYSPTTGLLYVNAIDWCTLFKLGPDPSWVATVPYTGLSNGWGQNDPVDKWHGWINAVDPASGKMRWRVKSATPMYAAVTPTAGDVLLTGDLDGNLLVLDARDGKELFRFNTGGPIAGGIVTYEKNGRQYVAVASGNSGGSIPLQGSATIVIFGL